MFSEEGACLSSSQQAPLTRTETDSNKKRVTKQKKMFDGSVQRVNRHTDQSQERRPVIWSVELEY
jgi:hypothetical protein